MFLCVTLLTVLYNFMESQSEPLQVIGPEAPLVAAAGEDLVLPCFIKPSTSAVDMTVEWLRLEEEASLVHLYRDHEDKNEDQAQSYRGRTSLFKEELQKGNASLKLSALQVSDEGEYKCLIEDKSWYDDITVHVIVEVLGSHPVIRMESYDNSGGINLVCESRGWKPEPEVLWLDREGATLPAEDTQIHRDTEGFSVKRRITVYESNRFYCRLQQKHHMMETDITINSEVFGVCKRPVYIAVSACLVAGLLVTCLFGLILTAFGYKKEHQKHKQSAELLMKKLFAVDVTLDPDTAHPQLTVSADGKEVTHGDTQQDLPDTPQRFNYLCVLGQQSFFSGRFYFEVQVRGKTAWTLGVVRENINRKDRIPRSPQTGFWTVGLRNENEYKAYADTDVPLTLREKVEKVGVFVDYEEGLVSFYDVKSSSHIYSFTAQSFTEELYPYFSPWYSENGNSAPLIISAKSKVVLTAKVTEQARAISQLENRIIVPEVENENVKVMEICKEVAPELTAKISEAVDVAHKLGRPMLPGEVHYHPFCAAPVCESRGWNPEPEVLWLDREGVTLPAEDTQIHRDTEGFSVKSCITVYDSSRFYCRLQQKHHMMETHIIINNNVFGVWKLAVGISVVACLIAVGLIVTVFFGYKKVSELQQVKQHAELLKRKLFAVDVTLDPDTAHPQLTVSADGKQVTRAERQQDLPDTPERFMYLCVLGQQSFSLGRFYYEVQVRGKTAWTLGVVRENINRKDRIPRSPQTGFWTVALRNENEYKAYADTDVSLTLREKVEVVGVFVDYEKGLVSFYDVKSSSHIYSFTAQSFTEKLYPYFSPRYLVDGSNSAPLIISAVTE
ncbi:butyrophilin subfamily 1 member A1-like [Hemibagrus wyckioides]|uniref:butyrophilin subfamily 1 member A1-like n=1 Tax=Hemibagrus wyckioides TaxID=337641 RepID=UPI00266DD0AD|nr:butyrophilin subfamily 1 member A1-like [Hemibagrus wyckioides]